MIKQKIFNVGDIVEAEINHFGFPCHDMDTLYSGSERYLVGKVHGYDDFGNGQELVVDFLNTDLFFDGRWSFPLGGHKRLKDEHWSMPGSLRLYNSGATREPHCQYNSIIELGTMPISNLSGDDDYYRTYFRKIVQISYRKWPVCKVEDKTLNIKYYMDYNQHIITATFECTYCCF